MTGLHWLSRRWVSVLVVVALVAAGLLVGSPVPGRAAVEPEKARDLPGLESARLSEPSAVVEEGDFSNPTPTDGDVRSVNDAADASRTATKQVPDLSKASLVARDATSDTYRNADGSLARVVYSTPTNFQAADGSWARMDNTIVAAGDGTLTARSMPHDVTFAGRADAPQVVNVAGAGWSLGFGITGAASTPARTRRPTLPEFPAAQKAPDGTTALDATPVSAGKSPVPEPVGFVGAEKATPSLSVVEYDVAPGVVARYSTAAGQVKEEIELASRPPSQPRFEFPLHASGVSARAAKDGGVEFVDSSGTLVAVMPDGVMNDSDPNRGLPLGHVSVRVEGTAAEPVLVVEPDLEWLQDPQRVFPVRIDPTIYVGWSTGSTDAYIQDTTPTTTYDWTSQYCCYDYFWNKVGVVWYLSWHVQRSFEQFDLGLSASQRVTNATWYGYFDQAGGGAHVNMNPVAGSWWASTVNWNNQPAAYTGTDFLPADDARSAVDISTWARGWTDGTLANNGLMFWDSGTWSTFAAAETTDVDGFGNPLKPFIYVTYNNLPPASQQTGPADQTVVATATPTLTSQSVTDVDGQAVQYRYIATTNPDGISGQVADSGWLTSPSWTVPAGVLRDGLTYYWTVYTFDGIHQNGGPAPTGPGVTAVAPRAFKVDLRLGAQATNPTDSIGPATVNVSNGNLTTGAATPSFPTLGGDLGFGFTYNSQQQSRQGLRGSYCDENSNPNWVIDAGQQPVLVRQDTQVNFNWNTGSFAANAPADNFLIQWKGYVKVPTTGSYQFGAISDDGIKITVNGTQVYADWTDHAAPSAPAYGSAVALNAGQLYPIQVDYYEHGGATKIALYAKGAVSEQIVGPSWLTSDGPVLPDGWSLSGGAPGGAAFLSAQLVSTSQVNIVDASGNPHNYTSKDGSSFTPPPGETGILTRDSATGRLTLQADNGVEYQFDADGRLTSARLAAIDDTTPAAPVFIWDSSNPPRLTKVTDSVSNRDITLTYSGGACPSGSGFSTPPAGMLCKISFWDGTDTGLLYNANGQLARVQNPGGAIVDYAYDSQGRVNAIRDTLAADMVAASLRANDDTTRTLITYTGDKVNGVKLAEPTAGAARPEHTYTYTTGETQVHVTGASEPNGWARKVTFDATGRLLTDTDPAGLSVTREWDVPNTLMAQTDLLLSVTDNATGLKSTTIYDPQGRPVEAYGPAPTGWFGTDRRPVSGHVNDVPKTTTAYDEGMPGLAVIYWNNTSLTGTPVAHTLGIGGSGGTIDKDWASASPIPGVVNVDNFSIRLTGEINLTQTGTYKFRANAKTDARLFIDDQLVSDWGAAFKGSGKTFVNNTAGWHRIRIEYKATTGNARLLVYWTPPGGTEAIIPGASMTPRYDLVTTSTAPDETTPSGRTTTIEYANPANKLPTATIVDPGGLNLRTTTTYETGGYLRRVARTLPKNTTAAESYTYYGATETRTIPTECGTGTPNQAGRLKLTTDIDPDGAGPLTSRVREQIYDDGGRVIATRTQGDARWTCHSYDSRGRLASTTDVLNHTITNAYTTPGVVVSTFVDSDNQTRSTRNDVDMLGRTLTYTDEQGTETRATYDQVGRVVDTYRKLPGGTDTQLTHQTYDTYNRPSVSTEYASATGRSTTIGYDAQGRPSTLTRANGVVTTTTYDPNTGRATGISNKQGGTTELSPWTYTYGLNGKIASETHAAASGQPARSRAFTYDKAGRLTQTNENSGATIRDYAFDANTNRCANATSCTSPTYTYDNADRITTSPVGTGYQYDGHGNLTQYTKTGGGTVTITYDPYDHAVTINDGTTKTVETLAPDGRVLRRRVYTPPNAGTPSEDITYGYSGPGDTPAWAKPTAGGSLTTYLGVVTDTGGTPTYPIANGHGDVVATTDATGTPTFITLPDEYGNGTPPADRLGWLGTAQRFTAHTGTTIIRMGQRLYDPRLGRFLQNDPIEAGSCNNQDYTCADPINARDLSGKSEFDHDWAIWAIATYGFTSQDAKLTFAAQNPQVIMEVVVFIDLGLVEDPAFSFGEETQAQVYAANPHLIPHEWGAAIIDLPGIVSDTGRLLADTAVQVVTYDPWGVNSWLLDKVGPFVVPAAKAIGGCAAGIAYGSMAGGWAAEQTGIQGLVLAGAVVGCFAGAAIANLASPNHAPFRPGG